MSNWGEEPLDIYERAFGIIANASNGDWSKESGEWQEAAAEFRKDYHHALDKHSWETERELLEQEINELRKEANRCEVSKLTHDVLYEMQNERKRQDEKWGGPEHDDKHRAKDWALYRAKREHDILDRSETARCNRDDLIEIAALAVAQIESMDRRWDKLSEEAGM